MINDIAVGIFPLSRAEQARKRIELAFLMESIKECEVTLHDLLQRKNEVESALLISSVVEKGLSI